VGIGTHPPVWSTNSKKLGDHLGKQKLGKEKKRKRKEERRGSIDIGAASGKIGRKKHRMLESDGNGEIGI